MEIKYSVAIVIILSGQIRGADSLKSERVSERLLSCQGDRWSDSSAIIALDLVVFVNGEETKKEEEDDMRFCYK